MKWTFFDAYLWQTMWNHAKKSMEGSKFSDSVFLQLDVRSSLLKTWKTRQTKTDVSQNFQILWPIQGGTMSKGMPRKCKKHGDGDDSIDSYQPAKVTSNFQKNREKLMSPILFKFYFLFLLREVFKWYLKTSLRRNKLLNFFWARGSFLWHPLFSVTNPLLPTCPDFELR